MEAEKHVAQLKSSEKIRSEVEKVKDKMKEYKEEVEVKEGLIKDLEKRLDKLERGETKRVI